MSHRRSRRAALAAGAVLAVVTALAAGCGVPLDDEANAVPANLLPASPSAAEPDPVVASSSDADPAASSAVPQSRLRLWFVQDDGLAAVESELPVGASADSVIAALASGPAPSPAGDALRTIATDPLTGEPLVSIVEGEPVPESPPADPGSSSKPLADAPVQVRLSPAFSALPSTEQVLLLGQVVLSLTGSGVPSVAFADDAGTSVGVPLPDGRLLDVPATARDYNALIVRP